VAEALVPLCRQLSRLRAERATPVPRAGPESAPALGAIGAIVRELWGLFVDDVWLATGVVVFVAGAWAIRASAGASKPWVGLLLAGGLNIVLALSASRRAKA
jgi:hypothetical protein